MNEERKSIECQGEGCGREAYEEDEDYYCCGRCGWAGSSNNPVVVLKRKIEDFESQLRDCHDLLNDCGFYYVGGKWVDGFNSEEEK